MCLINSNITETENKEVKRNSDITYEERCKIEFMVKKKYTMQEMAEELDNQRKLNNTNHTTQKRQKKLIIF